MHSRQSVRLQRLPKKPHRLRAIVRSRVRDRRETAVRREIVRKETVRRENADSATDRREIVRKETVRRASVDSVTARRARDRRETARRVSADSATDRREIVRKETARRVSADSVTDRRVIVRKAVWAEDRREAALIRTVSLIRMRIRMQYSRRDRQPGVVMTEETVRQAALRQILQMS